MKNFFKIIQSLYSYKLALVFMVLFFIIRIPALQIIPDYLNLSRIDSPESYILRLLSIVIGFSSFILTLILILYNFFSKKIKRNSFDFVFENPWMKFAFSLFSSSVIFIFLTILSLKISSNNTITTLLYLCSIIAFSNILMQFPILILTVKHSSSYEIINKLIDKIEKYDLKELYEPNSEKGTNVLEKLEKNRLIQIKDIGIISIKENDWVLPQRILNDLYDKLILPIESNFDKNNIEININAYNFVSRHFKKVAIEELDDITIRTLNSNLLRTHIHLAKKQILELRGNPIDDSIIDLNRLLIENHFFYNLQPKLLNNLIFVIKTHIESFDFNDEKIPTLHYKLENKDKEISNEFTIEKRHFYYVKNSLPDLFLRPLEFSIENKNKNVYSAYLNWNLHSFIDTVTNSNSLSEYLEYDLFKEYSYRVRRIIDLVIEKGINSNLLYYSKMQIIDWFEKDKRYCFEALYDLSFLVSNLNRQKNLYADTIYDYFQIARELVYSKVGKSNKQKAIGIIIDLGLEILKDKNSEKFVHEEIKKQLKWFNDSILKDRDDLELINEKFNEKINKLK